MIVTDVTHLLHCALGLKIQILYEESMVYFHC